MITKDNTYKFSYEGTSVSALYLGRICMINIDMSQDDYEDIYSFSKYFIEKKNKFIKEVSVDQDDIIEKYLKEISNYLRISWLICRMYDNYSLNDEHFYEFPITKYQINYVHLFLENDEIFELNDEQISHKKFTLKVTSEVKQELVIVERTTFDNIKSTYFTPYDKVIQKLASEEYPGKTRFAKWMIDFEFSFNFLSNKNKLPELKTKVNDFYRLKEYLPKLTSDIYLFRKDAQNYDDVKNGDIKYLDYPMPFSVTNSLDFITTGWLSGQQCCHLIIKVPAHSQVFLFSRKELGGGLPDIEGAIFPGRLHFEKIMSTLLDGQEKIFILCSYQDIGKKSALKLIDSYGENGSELDGGNKQKKNDENTKMYRKYLKYKTKYLFAKSQQTKN